MPGLTRPRRRAWRLLASALAGGGLTAAGLAPLAGGALAAEPPGGTTTSNETTSPSTTPPPAGETKEVREIKSSTNTPAPPPPPTTSTPAPTSTAPPTTTSAPATTPAPAAPVAPTVVLQRPQKPTTQSPKRAPATGATGATGKTQTKTANGAGAPLTGNVALPPGLIAAETGALAAELAAQAASTESLAFYRIPLFLLPIYQSAAAQYDVPWQILAAINEIETNYGSDLSVSSAGAVGWMQFMPATWLQYGVDALNSGYADPYNPVDAIFAAARYLRAAGAQSNLPNAILAYNHSQEYLSSVLLRAKLISAYPQAVIDTLTGLIDAHLPVSGKQFSFLDPHSAASSSTAGALGSPAPNAASSSTVASTPTPGSTAPPTPAAAAATVHGAPARTLQLVDLMSAPNAAVVAVQDGRIIKLGLSRKLGRYVVLRDLYGDVFTYAGLGSIARTYTPPKTQPAPVSAPAAQSSSNTKAPAPSEAAGIGAGAPLTLKPSTPAGLGVTGAGAKPSKGATSASGAPLTFSATGKVRLFAHPGNPDAVAARVVAAGAHGRASRTRNGLPLRVGSVVAQGTVLGHVLVPPGDRDGHLRFAINPAGDPNTIDPAPILQNWMQLEAALHPQGTKGEPRLLGATASGVFLVSRSQLERDILSDPGIVMSACSRAQVASGAIDKRVLAALAFLSRSGLKPTVRTVGCGAPHAVSSPLPPSGLADAVAISAINGVPIAGHQGPGSVADTTIRTLLTLHGEFRPRAIISLMRYPGTRSTIASSDHGDYIEVDFAKAAKLAPALKVSVAKAAHSAGVAPTAPSPLVAGGELSAAQWNVLLARIAVLPEPKVAAKPSSSAIPDRPAAPSGAGSGSAPSSPTG